MHVTTNVAGNSKLSVTISMPLCSLQRLDGIGATCHLLDIANCRVKLSSRVTTCSPLCWIKSGLLLLSKSLVSGHPISSYWSHQTQQFQLRDHCKHFESHQFQPAAFGNSPQRLYIHNSIKYIIRFQQFTVREILHHWSTMNTPPARILISSNRLSITAMALHTTDISIVSGSQQLQTSPIPITGSTYQPQIHDIVS